ncbi:MAG: cysteine hydrolase [Dorea sp.]|jgi:nicotinamidase/pyrazinamidase|nr:cysteine hydrolase [Dorea sp.]
MGKNLPVVYCVKGTLHPQIERLRESLPVDKPAFGSVELSHAIKEYFMEEMALCGEALESITVIGLCTDICVISNAMILKAVFPEVPVVVDAACCAGVTPKSHKNALEAMKICQIKVENEG